MTDALNAENKNKYLDENGLRHLVENLGGSGGNDMEPLTNDEIVEIMGSGGGSGGGGSIVIETHNTDPNAHADIRASIEGVKNVADTANATADDAKAIADTALEKAEEALNNGGGSGGSSLIDKNGNGFYLEDGIPKAKCLTEFENDPGSQVVTNYGGTPRYELYFEKADASLGLPENSYVASRPFAWWGNMDYHWLYIKMPADYTPNGTVTDNLYVPDGDPQPSEPAAGVTFKRFRICAKGGSSQNGVGQAVALKASQGIMAQYKHVSWNIDDEKIYTFFIDITSSLMGGENKEGYGNTTIRPWGITNGGTGARTVEEARKNLGIGMTPFRMIVTISPVANEEPNTFTEAVGPWLTLGNWKLATAYHTSNIEVSGMYNDDFLKISSLRCVNGSKSNQEYLKTWPIAISRTDGLSVDQAVSDYIQVNAQINDYIGVSKATCWAASVKDSNEKVLAISLYDFGGVNVENGTVSILAGYNQKYTVKNILLDLWACKKDMLLVPPEKEADVNG